jgi:hypothetical protein
VTPVLDQLDVASAFAVRTIGQQAAALRTAVAAWEPAPCPAPTRERTARPVRRSPERSWWRS